MRTFTNILWWGGGGVLFFLLSLFTLSHFSLLSSHIVIENGDRGESGRIMFDGREVVEMSLPVQGVMRYGYLGEPVSGTLDPDEVVAMRTERSYTRLSGKTEEGLPLFTVRSFPQRAFFNDGGKWRFLEYATTTTEWWEEETLSFFDRIIFSFFPSAFATDFYAGTGDGHVSAEGTDTFFNCNSAWTTARGAAIGLPNHTATIISVFSSIKSEFEPFVIDFCTLTISRGFLPFDTSMIPAGATITNARVYIYVTATYDDDNDAQAYIMLTTGSQATHTSLVAGDYDNVGTIQLHPNGQRKDITALATSTYTNFNLDATGIAEVRRQGEASTCSASTGITCIAVREGHDYENSRVDGVFAVSGITFSSADHAGISQDPYIDVTFFGGFNFWQFSDF